MSLPLPCPVEDESDEDVGTWSLPPGVESDSDEAPAAVTSASSAGQRRPQQKRKRDEQRTQACCKTPRPAYGHAVMEVFSQPRVVPAAAERGLLAVHSLDKDSRPSWDCNLQSDRERAAALIDSCKPYLLVLSPECRMYSIMQNLNLHRRDPASVAVQQLEADQHMDFCALLMRQQARHGRKFLLEQPSSASSWQLAALRSVMDSVPNTVLISFPQCRFGLKDPEGRPLQKLTKFLTNQRSIVHRFAGLKCICALLGEQHGHIEGQVGGHKVSRWAQVYPRPLVEAVVSCVQEDLRS